MFLLKKIVNIGEKNCEAEGGCAENPEENDSEQNKRKQSGEVSESLVEASSDGGNGSSAEDSSLERFYDDLSETDSDGPQVGEDTKLKKILIEAHADGTAEGKKLGLAEGRPDNDNDSRAESNIRQVVDCGDVTCGLSTECVPGEGGGPSEVEVTEKGEMPEEEEEVFEDPEGRWENTENMDPCIVDYLGKENCRAEARLAARRQARVEAREIRLRELERQQKEQEENADKVFDMSLASDNILRTGRVTPLAPLAPIVNAKDRPATANSYHSSRRSSENSLEDGSFCLRDIKHELKELDEKFRKAMIANAQLDNEKSELTYQVELLKDKLEDLEETHAQLARENREKTREHEQLKRVAVKLKEELSFYKSQLEERDKLIADYGLIIVGGEGEEEGTSERVLVSKENAELLQQAGDGSLDVRLKKLADERNELLDEVRHLKLELEEERSRKRSDSRGGYSSLTNGPLDEETSKLLSDYRFKLQKAEQDVSTLQANVARLESQVIRYKSAAESSEKAEDELKIEKRKLQRENRESIARIEELETANSHLMRRMDKLKNAKSTLLKEL